MKAKYILDAVYALRQSVDALDEAGKYSLASECHAAAHALEFMAGLKDIEIPVEEESK